MASEGPTETLKISAACSVLARHFRLLGMANFKRRPANVSFFVLITVLNLLTEQRHAANRRL